MEYEGNDPRMNRTFTVRRKAAKRILPWDLPIDEIELASPSPHDEFIRDTKRPRLEEPAPTSLEKATTEDATTAFPLIDVAPATADNDDANVDPVTQMQPNARTTGATGRWTLVEDTKLISAITNTRKKKKRKNWAAIAALVPGRTNVQCWNRWHNALNPSIDRTTGSTGKWEEEEDIKLKDAVQKHGNKDWVTIAALVPGRTRLQCRSRWDNALDNMNMTGSTGKWKEEEEIKLKAAVRTHGGKNWVAIATLVPGRTGIQCKNRWRTLNPSIDRVARHRCKWEEDEDIKLKDAVQKLGSNNWVAIAALVPSRTQIQCQNRWYGALNSSIDQTTGSTGINGKKRKTSS
jgi:hypothetical protein